MVAKKKPQSVPKPAPKNSKRTSVSAASDYGEPKFPYTTEPQALGRLLTEIPKRPKPTKISLDTLKSWSVSNNNNARTTINVLKKLGLLGSSGEPSEAYTEFMKSGTGPVVLGQKIKDVYKVLFENSHSPQTESNEELKKLFNIHSGGNEESRRLQLNTFKALAEHATFDSVGSEAEKLGHTAQKNQLIGNDAVVPLPPVQIDLHIHLPENKSSRDYQAIIQDIARYIYGKSVDGI